MKGDLQSAQTKLKEMDIRKQTEPEHLAGRMNDYFYYESAWHEDVDKEYVYSICVFVRPRVLLMFVVCSVLLRITSCE